MARREQIRPEINVTPLVDVVLVLLIIFMVIVPQMEKGAPVDLPGILNADEKGEGKLDPVMLSLTRSGTLYLEKNATDRASVAATLKAIHENQPERAIVLKADKQVRYDEVRELFKLCRELGFPGISLQVGDRNQQAKKEQS